MLEQIQKKLVEMSVFLDFRYINNRNIIGFCLCKDSLHHLEERKKFIANNFLSYLNRYFFRNTQTHTLSATSTVIEPKYDSIKGSALQILLKDREICYENPLIDYLNINNLRNKITDMRIILQDLQLFCFK